MKRPVKRNPLGHGNNSRLIEAMCKHQGNEVFSMRSLTSTIRMLNYIWSHFFLFFSVVFFGSSVNFFRSKNIFRDRFKDRFLILIMTITASTILKTKSGNFKVCFYEFKVDLHTFQLVLDGANLFAV